MWDLCQVPTLRRNLMLSASQNSLFYFIMKKTSNRYVCWINLLVLDQTQFIVSEFGIFGGFGWDRSSVLVGKPGFRRVWSSVFPDLGLSLACFWQNRFKVHAIWRGLNGVEDQFWLMNLSSKFNLSSLKKFEVCYICVRSDTKPHIARK